MDAQIDSKLQKSINTTKKLLGKHISKPVLADKYLGRPPFRFLLEIVNNVIQQTSFMKDAFSPKELKYDEIASPEDKRAVLKKVIEAIENETGEKCSARTSKILSGKEPEKTNEMLQLLAKAISSYSSKPKQETVKEAKVSEKATTLATEDEKEKIESPLCNNEGNKKEVRKEDNGSKKKSEQTKNGSGAASVKKSSKTTTASNIKGRSSGDKASLPVKAKSTSVKNSVSSTKVSSKEALKTKVGSPSASSSALLPPKKVSSTNLIKSHSRQSLAVKPSTSKVSILPEQTKNPGKHKDENVQKSESKDKLMQKSDDLPKSVVSAAAMPPETTADVPLQRPVTRTKYRQKTAEADAIDSAVGIDALETSLPDHEKCAVNAEENQEENHAFENDKSHCGSCGIRSGRSTSSEDVVTEHMNQKISEWRANSAETVRPIKKSESTTCNINRGSMKTGWITSSEQEICNVARPKTPIARVFESVANCEVGNDADVVEEPVTEAVAIPQKSNIVQEDTSKKILKRPITVLRDNESGDEEDDTFLVQEKIESEMDMERLQQGALLRNATGSSSAGGSFNMAYLPPEHCGLLVNQIMETQRELEKTSSENNQRHGLENELAERDKAAVREVYLKQIEDLKGAIQKMSKCANPLATIVQRSQDDACLMEIEYRKLKQENDRLQKKIDEAKCETSRMLYPLTEELAQLDTRIEKVEGAIILAKQRLSLIDSEYAGEFIAQLENTPTEDEVLIPPPELDPVWQFRGNFPPNATDDDENGGMEKKSLMDVFKRAVNMHEGSSWADGQVTRDCGVVTNYPRSIKKPVNITPKDERRLLNRTVYGDDSPLGRRTNRILRQLEREERPADKENKPSWWD